MSVAFTMQASRRFPAGTLVGAYKQSNWLQSQLPPTGAAQGSADATATVAADGSLTFQGLVAGTRYYAGKADGSLGYVSFTTDANSASSVAASRRAWVPGGIAETFPRNMYQNDNLSVLGSGLLYLAGGVVLPSGQQISSVTFRSSQTAAGTPTHQWFCIVRQSDLAVLAKTADATTAAWATNTPKTLALASPYTPSADEAVYLGIVVVAGTVPTLIGVGPNGTDISGISPPMSATSTGSLTTPASLGATAAALTAVSPLAYAYVS